MPGGTKLGRAKLRGIVSEGMILAAASWRSAPAARGSWCSIRGPRRARRSRSCSRSAPTSWSSRSRRTGRTASASTASPGRSMRRPAAPLAAEPWAVDPGSEGPLDAVAIDVQCPDLCPRFTARAFREVAIGPSPVWLQARLHRRGPAPDQQRGRHHQLRDAADRTAPARLRPGPDRRRAAHDPPRSGRRADTHARRPGAHARRRA